VFKTGKQHQQQQHQQTTTTTAASSTTAMSSTLQQQQRQQHYAGGPTNKVLLLVGSPGVGKTTLAHVLGNMAGYNTVEINASDDRTAAKFKNKLQSATEMHAEVFGGSARLVPICSWSTRLMVWRHPKVKVPWTCCCP